MHESAENCGVKSLFAVSFIVSCYTESGYITLIVSVKTLIAEICGKINFIYYIIYICICHLADFIIFNFHHRNLRNEQGDVFSE